MKNNNFDYSELGKSRKRSHGPVISESRGMLVPRSALLSDEGCDYQLYGVDHSMYVVNYDPDLWKLELRALLWESVIVYGYVSHKNHELELIHIKKDKKDPDSDYSKDDYYYEDNRDLDIIQSELEHFGGIEPAAA